MGAGNLLEALRKELEDCREITLFDDDGIFPDVRYRETSFDCFSDFVGPYSLLAAPVYHGVEILFLLPRHHAFEGHGLQDVDKHLFFDLFLAPWLRDLCRKLGSEQISFGYCFVPFRTIRYRLSLGLLRPGATFPVEPAGVC